MSNTCVSTLRRRINAQYLADAAESRRRLADLLQGYDPQAASALAGALVTAVRQGKRRGNPMQALLQEYRLDSREGLVLMAIAEALLRIPDAKTQDDFLREKLTAADWRHHLHTDASWLANVSATALLLSSGFENWRPADKTGIHIFEQLLGRLGAPLVRKAVAQAMHYLAGQFIFASSIAEALTRCRQFPESRFSFDMLGEAAVTRTDADRYFGAYLNAVETLGAHAADADLTANPGISVKLSALCPRYEPSQHRRAVDELSAKLAKLAAAARAASVGLTVDAEESERLDMSLTIFERVFCDSDLAGWPGLGLAVQAYQKRAPAVLAWLAELARRQGKKIPLRLVKGAYWDSEIKRGQENGLSDYPVFTHKSMTDFSYLACARFLLSQPDSFLPQFATHNAHTAAAVARLGRDHPGYEFQRLHGMGENLYDALSRTLPSAPPCRIYAPIGGHKELLPYLVRRLLENGANTSFINRIENPNIDLKDLTADPVAKALALDNPAPITVPAHLFGPERLNSEGLNLADLEQLQNLKQRIGGEPVAAGPVINGKTHVGAGQTVTAPYDRESVIGTYASATPEHMETALTSAARAFARWRLSPVAQRTAYLRRAADLFEQNRAELLSLCCREGGRTVRDALAEIREAVDYCRYYANQAERLFAEPLPLPGPTGEDNALRHYGRGVFLCLSPWNFPVAIFTGQVAAALAAGNTVIAKPAPQTVLTAWRCVQLLHEAGIPGNALHLLPADGEMTARHLIGDARVAGIAFTGSTAAARAINRQLAECEGEIVPFIAETGGQNVMIADSSALLEQLALDAVSSAFNSAGQRCSALRALLLQEEIADRTIDLLIGAMQELTLGNPCDYAIDIGPIISRAAAESLALHVERMAASCTLLYQTPRPADAGRGSFYPPTLIEIDALSRLRGEVFGPILHVLRYRRDNLPAVIDAVNALGYGLTLGIHSRLAHVHQTISRQLKVGNVYVNRNMIGAVVGVQPFGGMGLSGTGPKAGGPHYLSRFAVEQTLTVNTAAVGGNVALFKESE